jgi:exosortase A-associated hydrolase 2
LAAFFLDGQAGQLFALYRPPAPQTRHGGDVLFVPPFAEEMNRARRMATVMAERLAQIGWGSLVFDLYGTGDSTGEFADARVDTWRDDTRRALDWLAARRPPKLALLGLRLGALLALDVARGRSDLARVVLWHPVADGAQMLTQFLRLRLAAAIGGGASQGDTPQSLRARLAAGETLEIAGYDISPALAAEIDRMKLEPLGASCPAPIHWFDLAAEPGKPLSPVSSRIAEAWRAGGVASLDARTVQGDAFWTLLEISVAPELIEETAKVFA